MAWQNDVFTAIEATQKLEHRHQLTLTPGFDMNEKKERKALKQGELNMAIRTETKPPRMVCQEATDTVLQPGGVMSALQFIQRLEALGVRAVPSVASTGTMNGFSFEAEGVSFTGSKLGDGYKWAKLQTKGVEYVKDPDFEKLSYARRLAGQRAANIASAGPEQSACQDSTGLILRNPQSDLSRKRRFLSSFYEKVGVPRARFLPNLLKTHSPNKDLKT